MSNPLLGSEFHRLVQAGGPWLARLIRITSHASGNQYNANPVEFGEQDTQLAEAEVMTVTNLSESYEDGGVLEAGLESIALDVEGRWVIVERPSGSEVIPMKIISADTGGVYMLRAQCLDNGQFQDESNTTDVEGQNLAVDSGSSLPTGTIVLATPLPNPGQSAPYYVFSQSIHAKYL